MSHEIIFNKVKIGSASSFPYFQSGSLSVNGNTQELFTNTVVDVENPDLYQFFSEFKSVLESCNSQTATPNGSIRLEDPASMGIGSNNYTASMKETSIANNTLNLFASTKTSSGIEITSVIEISAVESEVELPSGHPLAGTHKQIEIKINCLGDISYDPVITSTITFR